MAITDSDTCVENITRILATVTATSLLSQPMHGIKYSIDRYRGLFDYHLNCLFESVFSDSNYGIVIGL